MGIWGDIAAGGLSLFGGLFGALGGGSGGDAIANEVSSTLKKIDPNLAPEVKMQVLLESIPELYEIPEELKAQLIEEAPQMKEMQLHALGKMEEIAQEGANASMKREFENARRLAETSAKGREEAIISDLQRRGVSGSGLEMTARQIASQEAADRAAEAANTQAVSNAANKALMNEALLRGYTNLRDQDYRTEAANTDIINRFNELNSKNKMAIRNANTELRNQTSASNVKAARDAASYNTQLANQRIAQEKENELRKAQILADAGAKQAARADAGSAARSGLIQSSFGTVAETIGNIYGNKKKETQTA